CKNDRVSVRFTEEDIRTPSLSLHHARETFDGKVLKEIWQKKKGAEFTHYGAISRQAPRLYEYPRFVRALDFPWPDTISTVVKKQRTHPGSKIGVTSIDEK